MPAPKNALFRLLWLPVGFTLLTGCVSVNVDTAPLAAALPGLTAQLAAAYPQAGTTGPTGSTVPTAPAPVAGTCQNGDTPAAGTAYGSTAQGDYDNVVLPASFSTYQDEQGITDRITQFSQDTTAEGTETWDDFQCLFSEAVAIWGAKQQQAATPVDASGCSSAIDPAGGTIAGTDALGAYNGVVLPGSFAAYESEEDVTDRISAFAADTTAEGSATWTAFQCDYAQAVAVWQGTPT